MIPEASTLEKNQNASSKRVRYKGISLDSVICADSNKLMYSVVTDSYGTVS